jgi:NAD dependent epimerase/dehydratase family enzyme
MKPYKKIVLAGGNGYLGTVLAKYYRDLADEVIILARKQKPVDGECAYRPLGWRNRSRMDGTPCRGRYADKPVR